MGARNRALHSRSFLTRVADQLAPRSRFARFWRRVSPWRLLRNLDKLF